MAEISFAKASISRVIPSPSLQKLAIFVILFEMMGGGGLMKYPNIRLKSGIFRGGQISNKYAQLK
jgi:hypothetical protein